jgi:hypothetical protein
MKGEAIGAARYGMKPPRKIWGVGETHNRSKVVQTSAQLLRTSTSQCARGERFVMAQLLQIFRPEQYIHGRRIAQE